MLLFYSVEFWVHLVIDQKIKKTLCVRYFTEWILGSFGYLAVKKRKSMLAILPSIFWIHSVIDW